MKYRERLIPTTVRDLADQLKVAMLALPQRRFMRTVVESESSYDYDGTFYSLQQGVENLRKKFGDTKANQLLDMLQQAKSHHDNGWASNDEKVMPQGPGWQEVCLGNYLLQDMEMVARNR